MQKKSRGWIELGDRREVRWVLERRETMQIKIISYHKCEAILKVNFSDFAVLAERFFYVIARCAA
jgi:hypothetical protein